MKRILLIITVFSILNTTGQKLQNIEVNTAESGSSKKVNLSEFHLNHVLYIKAFVLSDIYSSVSAQEMSFINSKIIENLNAGKRTQFVIQTSQKIAYRLAVSVVDNESKKMLVILTNFNPEKGIFEKKIKDNHYATTAEITGNIVLGNMFELPISNKQKYETEKDYLSLVNVSIFNTEVDTSEINSWFKLAEETQSDKMNNYNWLKSYYYLTQFNFEKSLEYLNNLKKSVAESPSGEQNQWGMFISVLSKEVAILSEMKN